MPSIAATDLWPFPDLRVTSGDLELRYIDDGTLLSLAALAAEGLHEESFMPFAVPWTRGTPLEIARSVLAYQWGARSRLSPEIWELELALLLDGVPVGIQAIGAKDFPATRTVGTGSWLGRAYQGRGVGRRMRALVLHLAFEGLDARTAVTSAWADNAPSNGVTRRLGYAPNGNVVEAREGVGVEHLRYRLDRGDWEANQAVHLPGVRLAGVDGVREYLSIA